jgi:hypothetical protein
MFMLLHLTKRTPRSTSLLHIFRRCMSSESSSIEKKAAQKLLKDADLAYLVPLYIEDDGGHDRKVAKWFKEKGDVINSQDVLCEIDTTEFSYDFTTEEEGFLAQCVALEGDGVVEDEELLALIVPTEEDLEDYNQKFASMCQVLEEEQKIANIQAAMAASGMDSEETVEDAVERVLKVTGLEQYEDVFNTLIVDEGFDTLCALQEIQEDDLKESGISKKGHRRALLKVLNIQSPISTDEQK